MALLKDSVVQGSLRVTDTLYTNLINGSGMSLIGAHTDGKNNAIIDITSTSAIANNKYQWGVNHLVPNGVVGSKTLLNTGIDNSTNKSAQFVFNYVSSSDSTLNYASIGLYNNPGLLKVDGAGKTTTTSLEVEKGITINNNEAIAHLKFTRTAGPSYLAIPNEHQLNFVTHDALTTAASIAVFFPKLKSDDTIDDGSYIVPGTTNRVNLGTSSLKWKNVFATNLDGALAASNITGTLGVDHGGTGLSSYTKGDILYASDGTTLSKLGIETTNEGYFLKATTANGPIWSNEITANDLVWYANSTTTTYYYITTDYAVTKETWIYGTITGSRNSTTGSFIATYHIHANGSGVIDAATFYDPTLQINVFRAHKDSANKLIISFTINNRYSRMRMSTHIDSSGSYYNYARSVTTTAPTVSTTYTGLREQNFYFPAHEIYWGGLWNSNINGIVKNTTEAAYGTTAFSYKGYYFGTSQTFGIPPGCITIETTTDGTNWSTGTSAYYTDNRKRDLFNHNAPLLPVGNLLTYDYWSDSHGVAFTASDGQTHYKPDITAGMGIRITADFTLCARRFYMNIIEVRWFSYIHTSTCTIEQYNQNTNTWTTIWSGDYANTDTTRYYHLGRNAYIGGTRTSNTTDINKLRFTIKVKTVGTTENDNRRYAPSIGQINTYGVGMPTNANSTDCRFAYEMARHGQPIYVNDYRGTEENNYTGGCRITTGNIHFGDDLRNTPANTEKWTNLYIGNNYNVNAANVHSQGRIYLYSAATQAHIIVGTSTTTAYTHTLPNNTGMVVSLSGSTAKGSSTKPVYVPATGIVTECSTYAGGSLVKLNNTSKGAQEAAFYAPTTGGAAGNPLIGAGTTSAPAWYGGLTLTGTDATTYNAVFANSVKVSGILKIITATDTGTQITFGQNDTNRWGLCSDASSNSTNFRIYSYNSDRSMIECYHNGVIRVRHNLLAIPTADQEAEVGVYTNAEGTNKLYLYRQPTASQTNSGLYCNGLDNENNTIGSILYNDSVTNRYSGRLEWLQLGHWYDEMLRIKSRHPWPYIRFDSVASTTSNPTYNTYNLNLLGQLVFQNYIKAKDNSNAYGATFFFRTYSVNSSNNTKTNYYEDFSFPSVPNNLTASATYDIITGKGGNLKANLYRLVDVSRGTAPSAHTYAAYEYISSANRARLAIMEYMKAKEGYQRLNFYLLADTASANNYGGLYIRGDYQDATANVCGFNISTGIFTAPKVYNAVWNDYAECRKASTSEPGRVITESTFGIMQLASERLMPGCKIISDTYGTLMGESDEAKTPIAVAGRVLVYPYKDKKYYHLGDAVCSAPNGTIDVMSREEIMMFPERIIGTVSEIPAYEEWQAGAKENPISIKVNGRIWIYVK